MRRFCLYVSTFLFFFAAQGLQAQEVTREPEAIAVLKEMGAYLAKQKKFHVSAESTMDRVLVNGQLIQFAHKTDVQVMRPNKMRVSTTGETGKKKDFIYDGKMFTLHDWAKGLYVSAVAPDTIEKLLEEIGRLYGIELPLADLFLWGTDRAPIDAIQQAFFVGEEMVNGKRCAHYAYRQTGMDWQLWVEKGKSPLPRKMVIVDQTDEARPQYIVSLEWNLSPSFARSAFGFTPPASARKIEITEIKAVVVTEKKPGEGS